MAAALEWLTSQSLGATAAAPTAAANAEQGWSACEEAATCIRGGILRRRAGASGGDGKGGGADALLAWVIEAGHDKASSVARMGAFRLMAAAFADCPSATLSAHFEKLCQLLRSGTSPAAHPAGCRRLACRAVAALVERGWEEDRSELRQQLQDALPRLLTALLGCAGKEEGEADAGVRAEALAGLVACQRVAGTVLKPHAAKIEAAAYAALDGPAGGEPALAAAAAACLARIPSTLSDPGNWTAMLLALLAEAARTLKQVWPDVPLGLDPFLKPGSPHRPALTPFPPAPPGKGGSAEVKAYCLLARRRLEATLGVAVALLEGGYHHGGGGHSPVALPTPAILALCDALLAATARGSALLGATPAALPATALHALQPMLRARGLALLAAFLRAAGGGPCLRHLPRLMRSVLRALSWPVAQGLRAQAYDLLSQLVLLTGAAAAGRVVEPALPLLAHHAGLLVRPQQATAASSSLAGGLTPSGGSSLTGPKRAKGRKRGSATTGTSAAAAPGAGAAAEEAGRDEAEVEALGRAVLKAIETILLGCGPLLSLEGRLLVDRVVGAGLAELNRGVPRDGGSGSGGSSNSRRLAWVRRNASLRAAFLEMAARALLVPRRDGAGSALVPLAARVFGALVLDADEGVARAALLGRAAAETIVHPRAAPLFIPRALLRLDEEEEGEGQGEMQVDVFNGGASLLPLGPADAAVAPQSGGGSGTTTAPAGRVADVWATAAAAGASGQAQKRGLPTESKAKEKEVEGSAPAASKKAKPSATAAAAPVPAAAKAAAAQATAPRQKEEEEEDGSEDEPLPDIVDDDGPDDESEED